MTEKSLSSIMVSSKADPRLLERAARSNEIRVVSVGVAKVQGHGVAEMHFAIGVADTKIYFEGVKALSFW